MIGRSYKAIALKVTSAALLAACAVSPVRAQQGKPGRPQIDAAIMYTAERGTAVVQSGNFWLQGGSLELGVDLRRGFGVAANVTGTHSATFPKSAPVSLVVTTAGPRYRWNIPSRHGQAQNVAITGEVLFGEVYGFNGFYPGKQASTDSAHAFAMQAGGAVDFALTKHVGIRAVEADWVRMQLPNSTTNVQSDFRISAGVVFRFNR